MAREVLERDGREEIAIVRKEKYYTFRNIHNGKFIVGNLIFEPYGQEGDTIDYVSEFDRKLILRNKYVQRGFLQELDDSGNPIGVEIDGKIIDPITDEQLLDVIKGRGAKNKIKEYTKGFTHQDKNTLLRMKKLCFDNDLPMSTYLVIQEEIENLPKKE